MIVVYVIAWLFAIALGTCVLVGALWLLSDKDSNPLDDPGVSQCFLRAGGISIAALILEFALPSGLFFLALQSAQWWGAIMFLFQRTFVQAFLLGIAYSFLMTMILAGLQLAIDSL